MHDAHSQRAEAFRRTFGAKGIAVLGHHDYSGHNTDSTIGVMGRQREALSRLRGLSNSFASRAFTWGGGFGVRA